MTKNGNGVKMKVDLALVNNNVLHLTQKFDEFIHGDYHDLKECVKKHDNAYWKVVGASGIISGAIVLLGWLLGR